LFVTDSALPVKSPFFKFPEKPGVMEKIPERQVICCFGLKGVYSEQERV
jgi:hypothetical protein